jgi:L(+)-tartrate dehydratase beta subunit
MTILNTPVSDLSALRVNDIFYLSGTIFTGRDEVYHKIIQEGINSPVNMNGMAIFHAGPIVREKELVSIGPTTSMRMELWSRDFLQKTGVKIMIGKGGMGSDTAETCRQFNAVHCVYPGGCAVLGASRIDAIENVYWPELGMAECMWALKANCFGPLIVSIDTQGNNLFADNQKYYKSNRDEAVHRLTKYLIESKWL